MKYKFNDRAVEISPTNWREAEFEFDLDINGAQVVKTDYDFDYNSNESLEETFGKVANEFFPNHLNIVQKQFVRRPEIPTTRRIHADFSADHSLFRAREAKQDLNILDTIPYYFEDPKNWFRITGFWVNGGPKNTSAPLIVSDIATVEQRVYDESFKTEQMPLRPWVKVVNPLYPNFNKDIVWYSFDDLEPNEILLLKHHNRYDPKHCAFHSGPVVLDKTLPQRRSCDGRILTIEKPKETKNTSEISRR